MKARPFTLVLRRGGLGDTLLLLPLLRGLRRCQPAAVLHLAGNADFCQPLLAAAAVDAVFSSEDLQLWALGSGSAAGRRAGQRLQAYSRVISDVALLLPGACRQQLLRLDQWQPGIPVARQLAQQLDLAPEWPADAWLLPPGPALSGPILLAPGSGGRAKCWPPQGWLQLAAQLVAATGRAPQVVVGPVEIERADPRRWPWPPGTSFLIPADTTALQQALLGAAVFVGNDSGPTHLAAMLGRPTIALFGPSDPALWAPPLPQVLVLRAPGGRLDELPPNVVLSAVLARLDG